MKIKSIEQSVDLSIIPFNILHVWIQINAPYRHNIKYSVEKVITVITGRYHAITLLRYHAIFLYFFLLFF